MTRGRHGETLDDADVLEAIADLIAAGETLDGDGGVRPQRLAEDLPFAMPTIRQRCVDLVDAGDLEIAWGIENRTPKRGFVLANDAEADDPRLMADGGTPTPNYPRALAPALAGTLAVVTTLTLATFDLLAPPTAADPAALVVVLVALLAGHLVCGGGQ